MIETLWAEVVYGHAQQRAVVLLVDLHGPIRSFAVNGAVESAQQ